jgi:hypothetical protein
VLPFGGSGGVFLEMTVAFLQHIYNIGSVKSFCQLMKGDEWQHVFSVTCPPHVFVALLYRA